MKKNLLIINADRHAAQIVKENLTAPSTNILCVSSIHEALFSFMDREYRVIILDARISAEDDHKLLAAMRKARTTSILILSSQSCRVERLKVLRAGSFGTNCPNVSLTPIHQGRSRNARGVHLSSRQNHFYRYSRL